MSPQSPATESRFPRSLAGLVLLTALGACAAPGGGAGSPAAAQSGGEVAASGGAPQSAPAAPDATQAVIDTSGADWIRLVSGEWLKGEVLLLEKETLEIDSEELDVLKLDWADVAELRSSRAFTVLLDDRSTVVGLLRVLEERAFVTGEAGTQEYPRARVFRFVPGEPREANYWSGKLSIGGTARSGNTDQTDVTATFSLMRRTADSRLPFSFDTAYSELDGTETTNNQRLRSQFDWFLTPSLFVTPVGVELYRDRFQNIDLRAAPFSGLGYTIVDRSRVEWDAQLGLGYRYTRYSSVTAGQDDTDEEGIGIVGTSFSWDLVRDVELDFDYAAQIGLEDTANTNQSATLELSMDLWWDFEFDVRLRWDRIGEPQPDSSGNVPKKDDFRLTVGLGWSF